jgi:hypothetical protein
MLYKVSERMGKKWTWRTLASLITPALGLLVMYEPQRTVEILAASRQHCYSGMITGSSLGIASRVALSIPRCAITNSDGVWVSHSESARS